MKVKNFLGWAVVVFMAYMLLFHPGNAATAVHHFLNRIEQAGSTISNFLNSL